MRKFKVISTCAALLLMVAIMAFGVYAAKTVSVSVSGTVSFKCTDVYIKVSYGIVGDADKNFGPYFSQPGANISWKDSDGNAVTFDATNNTFANKLPDMAFTESTTEDMPTCTYFVTVENMHGMDIGLSLGYKWTNNKENNVIVSKNSLLTGDKDSTTVDSSTKQNTAGVTYEKFVFAANSTKTLLVTLTLSNEEYVADGDLQIALSAAVDVNDVEAIGF